MESVHFLNGQLVNEDDLLISPRDLGYSRGYAVFDFMITSRGRPFMMEISGVCQSSANMHTNKNPLIRISI